MINFEKLTVEGYGSLIKRQDFILNRPGLNIIRGKVGSGKTSIPSVVYWVLYGLTLKKGSSIETWEEIRPKDFRGTFGEVKFRKGKHEYKIIRCIQFKGVVHDKQKGGSKILVIKDGKEVKSENKGKKGIQSLIDSIIGYSPDLFINSIIYGQRLKRIIEESGPNKKKVFDEAFETMFIDKAKNRAGDQLKDINILVDNLEDELQSLEERHDELGSTIEHLTKLEKNFEKDKKERLNIIAQEKDKLIKIDSVKIQKQLKELKPKKSEKELNKKLETLKELAFENNEKIVKHQGLESEANEWDKKLNKTKEELSKIKAKKCSQCNQVINEAKVKSLTLEKGKLIERYKTARDNTRLKAQKLNIKSLQKESGKLFKLVNRTKEALTEINSNKRTKSLLEENLKGIETKVNQLDSDYKKTFTSNLETSSDKFVTKQAKIKKKIKAVKLRIKEIEAQKDLYKWLIKEPLSNSGIKAYIFDSLLGKVNNHLSNYSDILGFRVEFGIDMDTAAKDFYQVIYKDDIIINYPDLSGGQKQLVDTAVALAIHDVISSLKPINILFLDEPFEGLGVEEIDIVADIIEFKAVNRSLFLITHHLSFNPTNSNTIYFELDSQGNTRIN